MTISEINERAREAGMTYGKYTALHAEELREKPEIRTKTPLPGAQSASMTNDYGISRCVVCGDDFSKYGPTQTVCCMECKRERDRKRRSATDERRKACRRAAEQRQRAKQKRLDGRKSG